MNDALPFCVNCLKKKCPECGSAIKDSLPFCINCLKKKWEYSKGFIKPKHNPYFLPWALPHFRSVVTENFVTDKRLFIQEIAECGEYFYDTIRNNFSCVLNKALGDVSGSAIPANIAMPTYPLNSIIVADVENNPHVFAVDISTVDNEIESGKLVSLKKIE